MERYRLRRHARPGATTQVETQNRDRLFTKVAVLLVGCPVPKAKPVPLLLVLIFCSQLSRG